jgi:apolipoprotein N-acyltransferase
MNSLKGDILISSVAGAMLALTYPSTFMPGWFPLLLICMPLFLWRLELAPNLKRSLLCILFFNIGLNLVGFYWIPHTLQEFGQLPYPVALLLGTLFSLILQPHWWLYAVWKTFRPGAPGGSWLSEKGILLSAFIITVLERYTPQQFPIFAGSPWLHLAPYLGLAPYFGVVLFSFMTFWVSLEVVVQLKTKHMRPQVWGVLGLFVLANAFAPLTVKKSSDKLNVRIVQANVGNFMKVSSEKGDVNSFEEINRRYYQLSVTDSGKKPDLIVWPETAYPDAFHGKEYLLPAIFTDIQKTTGAEVLIGGYEENPGTSSFDVIEAVYNSSILMSGERIKSSYHKNILIPFGETLPFGPFNRQIVSVVPAVSLFARGNGTPLMETRAKYRFVTPICYEILESNYMRSLLNEFGENRFIVNHTNDSWYGDTAEPHQHLFLSKWRALEFQLPIIRSTNTGISSVIYPDGSESPRLGVGEMKALNETVALGNPEATLYLKYGILPLVTFFLFLLGITWWRESN